MKFIHYPDIVQYRNAVKEVEYLRNRDSDESPVLTVTCSEKIHGTNMAFCINDKEQWFQSRNSILTNDLELTYKSGYENIDKFFGFSAFLKGVNNKVNVFKLIAGSLVYEYDIDLSKKTLALFFEYAGGNIQKNSACSGLDKRCFIFQHFMTKDTDAEPDENGYLESTEWIETKIGNKYISVDASNIFNIMNFNTWSVEVDFSKPAVSQNTFIGIVDELEQNSPVGKSFGIEDNVGEGIVCTFTYKDRLIKFKVKGDKHAKNSGKVKTLSPVDVEKMERVEQFAQTIIHDWRFEQGLCEVFGNDYSELDRKKIGEYLKWISIDTNKEEKDLIDESEFTMNDIMPIVKREAKKYFFNAEKESIGVE